MADAVIGRGLHSQGQVRAWCCLEKANGSISIRLVAVSRGIGPRVTYETDAEPASSQQKSQKFPTKYPPLTSLVIIAVPCALYSREVSWLTASRIRVLYFFLSGQ